MNLRDLRYLVALADKKHFGQAAAACHVSQPTLSAQIQKLEAYLGVKLIERQPRSVTLTQIGADIVDRARTVLRECDEMLHVARDFRDPLAGNLAVALIPTIGPYLLPLVAKKIRKHAPKLHLLLYEYRTATLLEKLRGGEIDMGIVALPIDADGIEARTLYHEDFVLALPPQHELAHKSHIKLSDLSGDSLLLLEDGHCLRDQALEVCSRADVSENQDYRATSLETLRQMVAAGWGITLLPKLATSGAFASGQNITLKSLAKPTPHRVVGAVWRKSSTRVAAIRAVSDVIAETIKHTN